MAGNSKSGFVGLMGPTNSGKSSLLNALVGTKISIVTPKVQTTYHRICGILGSAEDQIIFVDTPGFQTVRESVARLLNKVADKSGQGCDLFVWVFDVSHSQLEKQCLQLEPKIRKAEKKENSFCVLNKIDKISNKQLLLPKMQFMDELQLFSQVIPISVRKRDGLDLLLKEIRVKLVEGPRYFPDEDLTDRPEQFLASELIRESIYFSVQEEIPYSVWVEIESWEKAVARVPIIRSVIHVDSPSKKGILIGNQGEMLKRIGIRARRELEKLLGYQICLKLHVNVQNQWKKNQHKVTHYLELN